MIEKLHNKLKILTQVFKRSLLPNFLPVIVKTEDQYFK